MSGNAKYWSGVCYPENMLSDWQIKIGDLLQVPFAYAIHDLDHDSKSDHRKDHVHVVLAFPNTTTQKHALSVFNLLSSDGFTCCSTCQAVISIRHVYDYLIHDTDSCLKQGKELYTPDRRILGNGFDIGSYEQISLAEKDSISIELANIIVQQGFTNFMDFYIYVMSLHPDDVKYFEIIKSNSGFFERLSRGNYQKSLRILDIDESDELS